MVRSEEAVKALAIYVTYIYIYILRPLFQNAANAIPKKWACNANSKLS